MRWPDIAYLDQDYPPVPRWFTALLHLWSRRHCRRVGHHQMISGSAVCSHCGLIYRG